MTVWLYQTSFPSVKGGQVGSGGRNRWLLKKQQLGCGGFQVMLHLSCQRCGVLKIFGLMEFLRMLFEVPRARALEMEGLFLV